MNEWRNVAQAAYALSQGGPLCWHATPTPRGSCGDGVDDREDFKYRRLSGQPQFFGGLVGFCDLWAVPLSLLQAGDIGQHNSPHCFPEHVTFLAQPHESSTRRY